LFVGPDEQRSGQVGLSCREKHPLDRYRRELRHSLQVIAVVARFYEEVVSLQSARFTQTGEFEVAALIAGGKSNREIAHRLVIALSTAERHVANILRKLDFRSRPEIATWVVTRNSQAPHST
jgi:non-specific serine/threonine protein kinase